MTQQEAQEAFVTGQIFRNSILQALDARVIERLRITPISFELKHELEYPGKPVRHLFFVEEGMASMTNTFQDGSQIEVGTFGYESIIGLTALADDRCSLNRIYTQIAGHGYSCTLEAGRAEFFRGGKFQVLALQYLSRQSIETAQSAGCNGKHTMDQRLCRWLLICADRTQKMTFRLSHDFLANMIGSSRPTLSIAAGLLKAEGLIDYDRGTVSILDMACLRQRVCECYHVVKSYLNEESPLDVCKNCGS